MKRLLLFLTAVCFGLVSQAQLTQLVIEEYDPATVNPAYVQPAGTTTYRLYAELINPTDRLVTVWGAPVVTGTDENGPIIEECNPMFINTSTSWWNAAGGANLGVGINAFFASFVPELLGDSWLTVGVENDQQGGEAQQVGFTLTPSFNTANGVNFFGNDGSVFTVPTDPNCLGVGPNNRVLIGQLTTDGDIEYGINLGIIVEGVLYEYTYNDCLNQFNVDAGVIVQSTPELGTLFPLPSGTPGCTDANACNFDEDATEDDGSCEFVSCAGCTNDQACNYDENATIDDGSCEFVSCAGCTDSNACNFDAGATIDDGSCEFVSCAGCTNDQACNYDENATIDDGSCEFVSCAGCTDPSACNLDPAATIDDGSCIFPGDACDDGDATTINDEIQADCSCAGVQVPGCTDLAACNYDANATADDGSCFFPGDACDDGDPTTINDEIQADCSCEGTPLPEDCEGVPGGSAVPGTPCDDNDPSTENDVYQADCSCAGTLIPVPGCTDPAACNFDNTATVDDGSCLSNDCNGDCGGTAFVDGCGDCVGGNTGENAGVPGCTDPLASNFDGNATCDNGSCVFTTLNDVPAFALSLDVNLIGTCASLTGDIDQAVVTAPEATATATAGLWYEFVAVTAGVRVSVESADFDAVIELQDASHNVIDIEDAVAGNGTELLNTGDLVAGQSYFVRVAPASAVFAPAIFDICVEYLPDTRCNFGPGPYSFCDPFKAVWVPNNSPDYSVTNYIFNLTAEGETLVYETGAPFTIVILGNISGILWEQEYDVAIEVELAMVDGSGTPENIVVGNTEGCTLSTIASPLSNLRPSDNLVNAGPLFPGASIQTVPWICGVQEWEWEFTKDDGSGLPIQYFSGGTSRWVRLLDVPGLEAGEVYNVRTRPIFPSGQAVDFGAVDQIAIIGALGLTADIESPVVNAEDAERTIEDNFAALALYPNPNNGEFVNINLSNVAADVERITIDIFDTFGKRVISRQIANSGNSFNTIMPLDGIASGVYVVTIVAGEDVRTERMIVQR